MLTIAETAARLRVSRSAGRHRCATCPTEIPASRTLCYFCTRTVERDGRRHGCGGKAG
jgi:hypothetical protein